MTRSDIKKNNTFINRTMTPLQVVGDCAGIAMIIGLVALSLIVF